MTEPLSNLFGIVTRILKQRTIKVALKNISNGLNAHMLCYQYTIHYYKYTTVHFIPNKKVAGMWTRVN